MLAIAAIMAALLAVATLLPALPLSHGMIRIGDFPRQQFLFLALVLLAATLPFSDASWPWLATQGALLAVAAAHGAIIVRYTPLWHKQTADASDDGGQPIRLVSSNVKMSNNRYDALAREIGKADPDLLVLMEVDARWREGLGELLSRYETIVDQCRDNSYGMILASKFKLENTSAAELLTDGVPSVITDVIAPDGQRFRLYCIHPEPPVPQRSTEGRDGETSLVALKVREEELPVLVTGDLNDVAWSITTERFRKISGLLDPRIGRKVFSSFDARYFFMRWPLDHLFHSADFRLKDMRRLAPCGSDHFPVLFEIALYRREKAIDEPEEADGEELEEARDLVKEARERDEKPIGSDWEK